MLNDPVTIESSHLRHRKFSRAERKPDVTGAFVPFFRHFFEGKDVADYDFEDVVTAIGQPDFFTAKRKVSRKPTWRDVQQTWELKNTGKEMKFPVENTTWNAENILNRPHYFQVEEVQAKPEENQAKRGRDEEDDTQKPPTKKSRGGSSCVSSLFNEDKGSASGLNIFGPPGNDTTLTPDVQCAFYAIERLRAAWFITHSIVMLLTGNW